MSYLGVFCLRFYLKAYIFISSTQSVCKGGEWPLTRTYRGKANGRRDSEPWHAARLEGAKSR